MHAWLSSISVPFHRHWYTFFVEWYSFISKDFSGLYFSIFPQLSKNKKFQTKMFNRKPVFFHVFHHVHVKIVYFSASSLFCSHSMRRTSSERARRLNCLFVWTVSNKKPEDSSEETNRQGCCCQSNCQLAICHRSVLCFYFFVGRSMGMWWWLTRRSSLNYVL